MNHDQEQVYNQILSFIGSDRNLFQLEGPGGSGKSFTIGKVLRHKKLENLKVIVVAPTHKALNVLRSSIGCKNSNINFKTIDSWFGAIVDYDDDGNEFMDYTFNIYDENEKERKKTWEYDLVKIDEVSMLNRLHYTIIQQIIRKQNPNLQIITLGDRCQLSPVEPTETFDKIYKDFCIKHKIPVLPKHKEELSYFYVNHPVDVSLTINMRCENIEHNKLLLKIREYLLTTGRLPSRNDIIQSLKNSSSLQTENIVGEYCKFYLQGKRGILLNQKGTPKCDKSPYLDRVDTLNQNIRKILYPNSTEKFNDREQVIFYKTIYGVEGPIFTNSSTVCIDSVEKLDDFEIKLINITSGRKNESFFTKEEVEWLEKNTRFNVYKISIGNYVAYAVQDSSLREWNEFIRILKSLLLSKCKKQEKFADIRKIVFMEYYNYIRFYNLPINTYYATTINSSQGSTYQYVFVNQKNFNWFLNKDQKKYLKYLYTSFSRTKTNVIYNL